MKASTLTVCQETLDCFDSVNEWNEIYDFFHTKQTEEMLCDEQEGYMLRDEEETGNSKHHILRKAFNNIVFVERIHQVAYRNALTNSSLKKEEDHADEIFKRLQAVLTTTEQKNLLTELEAAWNSMYAVFLEYSYCQGIADSRVIHKELKQYGICVLKECA